MRRLEHADPAALREALAGREPVWLDLRDPSPEALQALGEVLHLGPLTLEALQPARNDLPRPRLELESDHLALTYYGVERWAGRISPRRLDLVRTRGCLLTVQRGPDAALDRARAGMPGGAAHPAYALLDALTDTFVDRLEELADVIDSADAELGATDARALARLKRDLGDLERVLRPQRALFDVRRDELEGIEPRARARVREVYGELVRVAEDVEVYRDRLTSVTDLQLNLVIKRLTVVATIFLPATLVTSFFGQNFGWLTARIGSAGAFWGLGVGLLALSTALVVWQLRRDR